METRAGKNIRVYYKDDISKISNRDFSSLVECYASVYNESWPDEHWTYRNAENRIIKGLEVTKKRNPILALLKVQEEVVGFSWITLTEPGFFQDDDFSDKLDLREKSNSALTIESWCDLAGFKKFVMFQETAVLKKYRLLDKKYTGSLLHEPLFQKAKELEYKVLFYWTNYSGAGFKLGIDAGWHPILFFPQKDRVIIKGSVINFVKYLELANNGNVKELFSLIRANRQSYFCQ